MPRDVKMYWYNKNVFELKEFMVSFLVVGTFQTALPSQYLFSFLLSLTNTESETNPNNNLMMRRAGLSTSTTGSTLPSTNFLRRTFFVFRYVANFFGYVRSSVSSYEKNVSPIKQKIHCLSIRTTFFPGTSVFFGKLGQKNGRRIYPNFFGLGMYPKNLRLT